MVDMCRWMVVFFVVFLFGMGQSFALEPNDVLIIANGDISESVRLAQYYCKRRGVSKDNILVLPLGANLDDSITRDNYEKYLAEPIRQKLYSLEFAGRFRVLLTTYGVPLKVGSRGQLKGQEEKLRQLKQLLEEGRAKLEKLNASSGSDKETKNVNRRLVYLQSGIDRILGKETNASVDSELSMVLFDDYDLYRWQPNWLSKKMTYWDFRTLMVCRLDGPGFEIAKTIVDKSLVAEKNGLNGTAYIDSGYSQTKNKPLFVKYDESLSNMAMVIKTQSKMSVVEDRTPGLFSPGECPSTALYCGWYSLKNYIDAFDFVNGAVGYHMASWEAMDIRDPNSSQWCPAMLVDGIAATLGAVSEPYLHSFPEPDDFFAELLGGYCLVEAYYRTKPFNSWQLILIGDPLYNPFSRKTLAGNRP